MLEIYIVLDQKKLSVVYKQRNKKTFAPINILLACWFDIV